MTDDPAHDAWQRYSGREGERWMLKPSDVERAFKNGFGWGREYELQQAYPRTQELSLLEYKTWVREFLLSLERRVKDLETQRCDRFVRD